MRNEGLERERWSSKEEAERLLMELPSHLANLELRLKASECLRALLENC